MHHTSYADHGPVLAEPARRSTDLTRTIIDLTPVRVDAPDRPRASVLLAAAPDAPPAETTATVADLVVAGRYLPAGAGSGPIAGDFYDLLRVGPDRVALVVGDVTGHGRGAARRMRTLRVATRSVALGQLGPRDCLTALDRFLDARPGEGLATLWYGEYVPSSGLLTHASAGHPPPVLSCHGEPAHLLEVADAPPLGTGLVDALAREHTLHLPPGAVLTAYSDGLVERAGADLTDQLDLLRRVVIEHTDPALTRTPQQVADAVLATLVADPASATDDVCLMVVRRLHAATTRSC